jgi:hypothetical protein
MGRVMMKRRNLRKKATVSLEYALAISNGIKTMANTTKIMTTSFILYPIHVESIGMGQAKADAFVSRACSV